MALSPEDSKQTKLLLKLAHDNSAKARSRLLSIISEIFDDREDILSDRERVLIYGILHRVVQDVEMTVRKNLSTKLAGMDDVPVELIRELANDDIEVAFPILSQSTVLSDEDLIQVIRMRSLEHQLAITVRRDFRCHYGISGRPIETHRYLSGSDLAPSRPESGTRGENV